MIHIFDVDYTVIKKPSMWYFLREALRKGIIRFSQIHQLPLDWIKYRLGHPNINFIENAVKHFVGVEQNVLEQIAQACFERSIQPNIYTDAANRIREAIGRGEKVIFATSSFHIVIQPLERFFGIEQSIASTLEFCDGKTSGRIIGNSFFGPQKKAAVEAWLGENGLNPAEACFYTDSYTDLSLLEFCGKPVAVNPDWILAREARKRGWEILRFTKTLGNRP